MTPITPRSPENKCFLTVPADHLAQPADHLIKEETI